MQTELNHTVKALFSKESLEQVSREDLHLMTQSYPYASIFHFLYSRKLQSLNDLRYPSSVAKTALYFSNPHWLHHQLRERTSVEALAEMEMAYENSHPHFAESYENDIEENMEEHKLIHITDDEDEIIQPDIIPVEVIKESIEQQDSHLLESPLENKLLETGKLTPDEELDNHTADKIEQDLVTHKPIEASADMGLIPLEPLYSIDYFASQGIRLREEDQQDPLGRKLKSFTEWLKSMKKIHPEKSKGQLDEKTEAVIKTEAELSNDRAEVLTETMAEVLLKQGLKEKAIEVYEKLSLLDPAKSATFAAKISELKAVGI